MKSVHGERSRTALLASYEKDESVIRLGRLLTKNGWALLCSAGTTTYLNENEIPCRDVAELVGKPILGHRVVTLSRELHAALLSTPADKKELEELGIEAIDLVYVTLYPLEKAIESGASPEKILEMTDIGGPTLLRGAAKGRRVVLSSPQQIDEFEDRLQSGAFDEKYLVSLAATAERRVADYVDASARYWEMKMK